MYKRPAIPSSLFMPLYARTNGRSERGADKQERVGCLPRRRHQQTHKTDIDVKPLNHSTSIKPIVGCVHVCFQVNKTNSFSQKPCFKETKDLEPLTLSSWSLVNSIIVLNVDRILQDKCWLSASAYWAPSEVHWRQIRIISWIHRRNMN